MTKRKAAIWLNRTTGMQEAIEIGVLQRSSIAPILFMFFTTPLFKLFSNEKKKASVIIYGYIDNKLITCRGNSESMCISWWVEAFKKVEE